MKENTYEYEYKKLTDNINIISSPSRATIGVIKGTKDIAIVDTGDSEEYVSNLFKFINKNKLKYSLLTHFHEDHTLGLNFLECTSIGQENIKQNLIEFQNLDWSNEGLKKRIEEGTLYEGMYDWINTEYPDRSKLIFKIPDIIYKEKLTIDIGEQLIELSHIECNHTNDSTVVFVPNEESLFLGDCLLPGRDLKLDSKIFRKTLNYLISLDCKIMVEGHNPPLTNGKGNLYLSDMLTVIDFVERYNAESNNKIDIMVNKMNIFDKDLTKGYLDLFVNGIDVV